MKNGWNLCKAVHSRTRGMKRGFRLGSEEGSTLVEFAVTVPLLLMLLTGMGAFAVALYYQQQISNVTSSTVLALGDQGANIADPCTQAVTWVTGALPSAWSGNLKYSLTTYDVNGVSHSPFPVLTSGTNFKCSSSTYAATNMAPNEPIILTVSYSYTTLSVFSFLGAADPSSFSSGGYSLALSATHAAIYM